MNKKSIGAIIREVEQENLLFKNKSALDSVREPKSIVGREDQAKQLVRFLHARQGSIVPFVSVYGRSGSGKSTLVRFVCENMDDVLHCFVNLRSAKTIFGCANLILSELGKPNLKSPQGLGLAIENIEKAILTRLAEQKKRIFVLVLDEFDMIFYDSRNKPSDFVYKLVIVGENLKKKGYQMCIIGISNNVVSEYDLDERVRSRIGNAEVFFPSYAQSEALDILKERAKEAFSSKVDRSVLTYCATLGAQEHGDARRVIDLLRVGAEIASTKGEKLSKLHIDLASARLQNDRVAEILGKSSDHFKYVCAAITSLTFLGNDDWYYTSTIYDEYVEAAKSRLKPLSYRRISEILVDIENTGLVTSQTHSRGRHGYGTLYKLLFPPEMVGAAISKEWWDSVVQRKKDMILQIKEKELDKMTGKLVDIYYKHPLTRHLYKP